MTAKRGKLNDFWGKKSETPDTPAIPSKTDSESTQAKPARKARATGDVVALNLRLTPEAWKALKTLSIDLPGRTMQDLLLEGLDLVFVHYGRKPVARKG